MFRLRAFDDLRQVALQLLERQAAQRVVAAERHDQNPDVAFERPVEAAQPAGGRVARDAGIHDLVTQVLGVHPLLEQRGVRLARRQSEARRQAVAKDHDARPARGTGVAEAAGLAAAGALAGAAAPAEPSRGPESHAGAASEPTIAAAAIRRRNVEGFIDPDVCAAALRARQWPARSWPDGAAQTPARDRRASVRATIRALAAGHPSSPRAAVSPIVPPRLADTRRPCSRTREPYGILP